MAATSGNTTFAFVKTVVSDVANVGDSEGAAAKAAAEATHAAAIDAEVTAAGGTAPTFVTHVQNRTSHGKDELITGLYWIVIPAGP